MRQFVLLFLLLLSFVSYGQQMNYAEWSAEAKTNIRLLPKYGNVTKTEQQKILDKQLIDDYIKSEGSREKGSEKLVALGFNYLGKGDSKTAMYRFNQAWLLNPENENVFWGFGAVYFTYADFKKANEQYDEGLAINPKSSNILTDKATMHMSDYIESRDKKDIKKAIDILLKSYTYNNQNQNTLYKLSVCYFNLDDCKNAVRYLNECDKIGSGPVAPDYRAEVNAKCK